MRTESGNGNYRRKVFDEGYHVNIRTYTLHYISQHDKIFEPFCTETIKSLSEYSSHHRFKYSNRAITVKYSSIQFINTKVLYFFLVSVIYVL